MNDLINMVKKDGYHLKSIENQTPEICLEAVKQNQCAIQYIKAYNQKFG